MADSVVKTLVLEFETAYKREGVEAAKRGLNELNTSAKTLKETVVENIAKIDKAYASLGKTKIKSPETKVLLKDLDDLKKVLNTIDNDWEKLNTDQKKALTEITKLTDKYVNELEKASKAQKDIGSNKGIADLLDSVSLLTPALGKYGFAVDKVTSSISQYVIAAKEGSAANTTIGKGLEFLKSKWLAVGAAAAAAGAGAAAFFTKTAEGSEGIKVFGESLSLQFENILGNLGKKFGEILKGNIKGAFTGGILTLSDAEAKSIAESGIAIEKQINQLAKLSAEKNIAIAVDRELISQQANSLSEVNKQLEALTRVRKVDNEVDAAQIRIAKLKLEQLNKELKAKASLLPVDIARRNAAKIEVLNAKAAASAGDSLFNRLGKGLERNKEAIIKTFKDLEKELAKQADEVNFGASINELFNVDPEKQTEADKLKIKRAISIQLDFIKNQFDELKDKEENGLEIEPQVKLDIEKAKKYLQERLDRIEGITFGAVPLLKKDLKQDEIEKFQKDIEDNLQGAIITISSKLDFSFTELTTDEKKKLIEKAADSAGLTGEAKDEFTKILLHKLGLESVQIAPVILKTGKKGAKTEEEIEHIKKLKNAISDVQREAENAFNTYYELEIKKTEVLITEQQRRVDKFNEIAALGNAEQLQLEEERLNRLIQKREAAAKRQAQIDALLKLSNTGVAISNYVAAITSDAVKKDPIVAIIEGIALLGAVFAGVSQLKSAFQGFEEGTMNVSNDPKTFKARGKSDTIPAWLAPGEMVLPVKVAEQIRQEVSNVNEIPKLLKRSGSMYGYILNENKNNSSASYGNIELLLKENNKLLKEGNEKLKGTDVNILFDHEGYRIQQKRAERQRYKHNLQRR
ncbi:MAG TPA: hypothetical protein PK210_05045 [Bacteroidia bacterium]|nr:hypothetical protein [Bacteroidia bacterium]